MMSEVIMVKGSGVGKRTGWGLSKPGRNMALRLSPRVAGGCACVQNTDTASLTYDGRGQSRGGAVGRSLVGWRGVGGAVLVFWGKPQRGVAGLPLSNKREMPITSHKGIGIEEMTDDNTINLY